MWLNFRFCGSAEGAAVDSLTMPARAHFANQTEQTCFRSIMVCLCVSSTIGCNLQKQIAVPVPVTIIKSTMRPWCVSDRPHFYKSASDSTPKASDSTHKAIFGVFFAGRGSTLQADFLFAGDFAGRPKAGLQSPNPHLQSHVFKTPACKILQVGLQKKRYVCGATVSPSIACE